MKPMNANEADYEEFEILGREALFTNMRIDRNTLPDGLYAYDLRDECDGEPCELKSFVLVNHWGTVVVKEPVEGADGGVELTLDDCNFLGGDISLEDFLNGSPKMEQRM